MTLEARALQIWLNSHGAALTVDGQAGPQTRAAIIETFRNTAAPAASPGHIRLVAEQMGGDINQMLAVAAIEAPRGGWDQSGLLACLYERHFLWKRIQIKVPLLSDPVPGGYTLDADRDGVNDSWEKVADAACRVGADKALECASWGKFQIMGAWWQRLGYASVLDFVWKLSRDEAAHYEAFARFIGAMGLTGAYRAIGGHPDDCRAFAKGFNGSGYEKHDYHGRIAAAYRRLARLT